MSVIIQVRGGRDRTPPDHSGPIPGDQRFACHTDQDLLSLVDPLFAVLFVSGPGLLDVPAFSFSFISHPFSFSDYFFFLSFILLFFSFFFFFPEVS